MPTEEKTVTEMTKILALIVASACTSNNLVFTDHKQRSDSGLGRKWKRFDSSNFDSADLNPAISLGHKHSTTPSTSLVETLRELLWRFLLRPPKNVSIQGGVHLF